MTRQRPLLLVATGPTAGQFAFGPFRQVADVMVVSDAYKLCDFAKIIYATDFDWWRYHGPALATHQSQKFSLAVSGEERHPLCKYLENLGRVGFSQVEGHVFSGHNSGYVALQLAVIMGYIDIFLVGFDMGVTGKTHFFGDHPPQLRHFSDYNLFISDFASMSGYVKSKVNIQLATKPSGLEPYFPYRSPADVLRFCKEVDGRNPGLVLADHEG